MTETRDPQDVVEVPERVVEAVAAAVSPAATGRAGRVFCEAAAEDDHDYHDGACRECGTAEAPAEPVTDHERGEPQRQTLQPGSRYQFRGVFTIEAVGDTPVDIEWARVIDDPYEQDLAREARLHDDLDAARDEIKRLRAEITEWRIEVLVREGETLHVDEDRARLRTTVAAQVAALARVRARHRPTEDTHVASGPGCAECRAPYPCATIRDLDARRPTRKG